MLQKIEIFVVGILIGAFVLELFHTHYAGLSLSFFAKISFQNDWGKSNVYGTLVKLDEAIKKAQQDVEGLQNMKPPERWNDKRLPDQFFQIVDLARSKLADEQGRKDKFIATALLAGKESDVWYYINNKDS